MPTEVTAGGAALAAELAAGAATAITPALAAEPAGRRAASEIAQALAVGRRLARGVRDRAGACRGRAGARRPAGAWPVASAITPALAAERAGWA